MEKVRFKKGYKDISGSFWYMLVDSAKKRNLELNVDKEYLWNLFITQDKKCALSGVNITLDKFGKIKDSLGDNYFASLDRIDNKIGYVDGNVRWVAREINYMKWKFSDETFINFCKNVSNTSC